MTKEKLLVLAKAMPELSTKYAHTICVAGITESGDWRRIYPIPWEKFRRDSGTNFPKKSWIEYELLSDKQSDHRPESRKIDYDTIRILGPEKFSLIESMLKERLTTVEALMEKGITVNSLGVVDPLQVYDFCPTENEHYEELVTRKAQKDLLGNDVVKIDIPEYKYRYIVKDDSIGIRHEMLCEDWEVGELYRRCQMYCKLGKYKDVNEVHEKVKYKMYDEMFGVIDSKQNHRSGHVKFIVGSHSRFPTYMVVGVIYPKKADVEPKQMTLS